MDAPPASTQAMSMSTVRPSGARARRPRRVPAGQVQRGPGQAVLAAEAAAERRAQRARDLLAVLITQVLGAERRR